MFSEDIRVLRNMRSSCAGHDHEACERVLLQGKAYVDVLLAQSEVNLLTELGPVQPEYTLQL